VAATAEERQRLEELDAQLEADDGPTVRAPRPAHRTQSRAHDQICALPHQ
jgi:hypothetical protein